MWNWKLYIFILMQWTKWFIFWNIFLYCKIINFLQLFLATCCLCILQTQLVFWYFFYFELIFLYVCKSWCITTRYYISHFLVHEDNKNTRKIKLLIKSVNQTLINFLFQIWNVVNIVNIELTNLLSFPRKASFITSELV